MPTLGRIQSSEHLDAEHQDVVSLYFHLPFCAKKCPYCHFYVLPSKEEMHSVFIDTLLQEFKQKLPLLQGRTIYSIYLGGGTPSQLSPTLIQKLLEGVLSSDLRFHPQLEITLEANPEDLSKEYLKNLKKLPINRLSMGVQSFHEPSLHMLQREHSSLKAYEAIHQAADLGFHNISIDLMYDLPKQTLESWTYTLNTLKTLPITHLSLYNLTLEPHTVFYKQRKNLEPTIPDDALSLTLLQTAVDTLEALGFKRYEISAFAKEGLYSKHNVGYWIGREFLGFGPSAFSYFQGKRFRNVCDLKKYTQAIQEGLSATDFEEMLAPEAALRERLVIALRLQEGVDLTRLDPLPENLYHELQLLEEKGWIEKRLNRLLLTAEGQLFYDTVATELI